MNAPNVLIVTTSHDELGSTGQKTGVWLEELAAPYYQFADQNASITIVSPKGEQVPLDPKSELPDWQTEFTKRFTNDAIAMNTIQNAGKISDVNPNDFDILFFPGGHGPMWDLGDNAEVANIISSFDQAKKPIGLVCHGVVALKGVKNDDGSSFVDGRKVTSFSNTEEDAVGLTAVVPFLLETALIEEGGVYYKGDDWSEFVVSDDNLITGQNPQSSVLAAQKTIELI